MSLIKSLITNRKRTGQAIIEYVLLVAIAIIALFMTTDFITKSRQGEGGVSGFWSHFKTVNSYIAGANLVQDYNYNDNNY